MIYKLSALDGKYSMYVFRTDSFVPDIKQKCNTMPEDKKGMYVSQHISLTQNTECEKAKI